MDADASGTPELADCESHSNKPPTSKPRKRIRRAYEEFKTLSDREQGQAILDMMEHEYNWEADDSISGFKKYWEVQKVCSAIENAAQC